MMKRHFPNNLSPEDLRAYRRWTRGLYLSYFAVVVVALGLTFLNRPAEEMVASRDALIKQIIANGNVSNRHAANP
jgi:hypothetical protein